MDAIYTTAVVLLVLLAICGALSTDFKDNLAQRIALALVAIGGTGEVWCVVKASCLTSNARTLLMVGLVVYGLGTVAKVIRYRG